MASFARRFFDYQIEKRLDGKYNIVKGEGRGKSLRIIRTGIERKSEADELLKRAKRNRW